MILNTKKSIFSPVYEKSKNSYYTPYLCHVETSQTFESFEHRWSDRIWHRNFNGAARTTSDSSFIMHYLPKETIQPSTFYIGFHHLDYAPTKFIEIKGDTEISLFMEKFSNLAYPYNNCSEGDSLQYSSNNYTYEACLQECWAREVYEKCSCTLPGWTILDDTVPNCKLSIYTMLAIDMDENDKFQVPDMCHTFAFGNQGITRKSVSTISNMCRNKCKPACQLLNYEIISVDSTFKRINDHRGNILDGLGRCAKKLQVETCRDIAVKIQFDRKYYSSSVQTADYPVQSMWAEIGGNMGLLIGASVITVVEFIDLILQCGKTSVTKCSRNFPNGKK